MADPVYQDQPYMRKSFLFFSDVYLTGAVHGALQANPYDFPLVFFGPSGLRDGFEFAFTNPISA